ncbi:MAG TPA: carboxypeptidase-like regulatory domain-containing protein, partial [bacterium]|nr:carboxypeptidase-like regulatory domain-containing protein [bacterium]
MGRKLLILVSLITFAVSGFAQDGLRINGKVQDAATGEPLIGANVQIEGENIGAATDLEGRFTVTYQAQSAFNLIVGYVGYKTRTIALSPNGDVTNLHIEMEQDVFQGEEVVITGIGSRREKSIAEVAVSRLGMDDLSTVNSYQDFAQVVTGKVSGVNVESSSGNIGSGIRFNMRSGGGLNGDEQPVIYVDGIRIDNAEIEPFDIGGQGVAMLADLNPEDIRDIEILKGPAAAASYGTRGSNGVVFITTKRGRYAPGTPQPLSLDYKYVTGYNAPSYKYSEQDYLTYKSINNVFRNGPIQQHNLKATGGSSLIKYYVGVDWRNEFGIIPDNYMDRKNLRANFDVIPNENLVVNVSTNYTLNEIEHPHNDNDIYGFLGNTILAPVPYFSTDSTAILALENTTDINRFIGSVEAIYNPFANLELRLSAGMDDSDLRTDQVFPADFQYQYFPSGRRSVYTRQNTQNTYTIDGNYTYNLTHELQVNSSLGAQLFDRRTRTFFADNQDYLSELITNIGAGETLIDLDETLTHVKEAGIYTEHAFSLMNRYYFSMMLRRDFASAIGIEAPSIYYPRASLAVRLDRFKFTPAVFSLLKLRTAYGESGVLPQLTDGIPLLWEAEPSGYGAGAVLNAIGNSEIRPERLKEWEFGLEAEFTRRFSAEFTYYRQRSEDSIIEFRNAPSTGRTASAVPFNIGVIKGWGTEILLQARPFRTR